MLQPHIKHKWVCMKAAVGMHGTGVRAQRQAICEGESCGNGGHSWKVAKKQQRWVCEWVVKELFVVCCLLLQGQQWGLEVGMRMLPLGLRRGKMVGQHLQSPV